MFDKFVELLETLLVRRSELPTRSINNEDVGSWYIALIHQKFPEVGDVHRLGACIKRLVEKIVQTARQMEIIAPLLEKLAPFMNKRKVQFFSDMRMKVLANKSADIKAAAQKILKSSHAEVLVEDQIQRESLAAKLINQIELDDVYVLGNIARDKNSSDMDRLGIALQTSIGTRSIDLLNPLVATFELDGDMIKITGRSKIREKDPAKKAAEAEVHRSVQPVGMTAKQFMDGLHTYRKATEDIVQIKNYDNQKISNFFNSGLSAVVKEYYPDQKALHGRSGTHLTRAIHFQLSYAVYGKTNESKIAYGKRVLHHKDYNSIPNYDAVSIKKTVEVYKLPELEEKVVVYPKKRKRHCIPTGPQFVTFKSETGEAVIYQKFPKKYHISDTEAKERVLTAEEFLKKNNIKLTNDNIRLTGIGSKLVNLLRTK